MELQSLNPELTEIYKSIVSHVNVTSIDHFKYLETILRDKTYTEGEYRALYNLLAFVLRTLNDNEKKN